MNQNFEYNKETIELAFRKFQANVYFDKNDLLNRSKLAELRSNKSDFDSYFSDLASKIIQGPDSFTKYLGDIKLKILPKNIEPNAREFNFPSNFYTNEHLLKNSDIQSLSIFIDLPIELHLISVLWLMKYGCAIDEGLENTNYGNRLFINQNKELGEGRTLFKPYQEQYQLWWSKAVDKTKELLDSKEDATILNFDLKSFFHTIRFDFNELEKSILGLDSKETYYNLKGIKEDCIHILLKKIHEVYLEKIKRIGFSTALSNENGLTPLPIGLLTSHVLANKYLKNFDKQIIEELNPVYYGRYVDDILIVLKDRVLHGNYINEEQKSDLNSDINKDDFATHLFFRKYLSKIFHFDISEEKIEYRINSNEKLLAEYKELKLQSSKVFIYQFNHNMSPNLLSKFVKEQEQRSYIFQFLSDESDDMFNEFEIDAFEDSLDENDVNKSKFRAQEINKFRFSVFMAKLIKRRMLNGGSYKDEEIEKVSKYFKGIYCLKNLHFWEKLFTLYVIANDKYKFFSLIESIVDEIEKVELNVDHELNFSDEKEKTKINKEVKNQIKSNLISHLELSLKMALGLNPNFFNSEGEEFNPRFSSDNQRKLIERIILKNRKIEGVEGFDTLKSEMLFFRKTCLLRHSYVFYPLVQYVDYVKESTFALFKNGIFNRLEKGNNLSFDISNKHLIPYRIKFYEAALFTIYQEIYNKSKYRCSNCKRWFENDVLISSEYLKIAFNLFSDINKTKKKNTLIEEYFKSTQESDPHLIFDGKDNFCDDVYVKSRTKNFLIHQLNLKNGGKSQEKLRVAMINKYVPMSDYEASLEGNPILTEKRVQTFLNIIDQVKKVPECDIFVMPELSLPHDLLHTFVSKSAHNQIAFISGVEHWKASNIGYNFVITNLPIIVDGDRDAIPVIRLKNHYAPVEEDWINGKYMIVPKPLPYRYDLFIWRGVYFSTYYCYELADVFHRYALNGKIDVLFAPVWNSDVNYYNNIAEVTTRDMHVHVVQVNTSQYGESRVIRPSDSERKDKARVKGGTVTGYDITLSVSDIELKKYRNFQTKNFATQKQIGTYKPTPPDFPIEDVLCRIKNKEFKWNSPLRNLNNI